MKKNLRVWMISVAIGVVQGCSSDASQSEMPVDEAKQQASALGGQSGVVDNDSQKDVVKVAVESPDHTTLVTALKTAEYVDVLSNAGPFTVFAPTNAAFEKLPSGTVEDLLKPENKATLRTILEYHVYVGGIKTDLMSDGLSLGQASGHNISIGVKDGKYTVNGANIIASIPASNGIIHVIYQVLLPPDK